MALVRLMKREILRQYSQCQFSNSFIRCHVTLQGHRRLVRNRQTLFVRIVFFY